MKGTNQSRNKTINYRPQYRLPLDSREWMDRWYSWPVEDYDNEGRNDLRSENTEKDRFSIIRVDLREWRSPTKSNIRGY